MSIVGRPPGAAPVPGSGSAKMKADDFLGTGSRILGLMRRDRLRLVSVLALGALMVCGMLTIPSLLGRATDLVIDGVRAGGVDFDRLSVLLGGTAAVALVTFGITVLNGRMVARLAQTMAFGLRRDTAAKVTTLPLRYFDFRSRGEVLSRVTNDIDNLTQTVAQVTQRVVQGTLTLIGVPIVMLTISPILTGVVLLTLPLTVLAARAIGRRAQPRFAEQWAATGRLNGHVEEMITGHRLVTLFGRRVESAETFARHNDDLYASGLRAQWVSALLGPTMQFLGSVTYVLVAVVGVLRLVSGALTFGQIQAFIQYTTQFSNPLNMLAALFAQIQSGVASAERVFELLDAEDQSPDRDGPAAMNGSAGTSELPDKNGLPETKGLVRFESVSFRYVPDEPLIEGLDLAAEPGSTVAIVGHTGAGKTTLVNLLMRFYDLDSGRITIDGVDIATLPRESVRARIGMVLQDTWLFGGTIAENIAYGKPDATRDEVVAAAKAAHADHLIRALPDGYDTVVDTEDGGLSAGERQLITIARANLVDPAILVLDEATSSVDTRTEMLVQQGMVALRRGRTSFVIAHRLSTIRDADLIVVMANGRVVEQGDHESLLAAGRTYAGLHNTQLEPPSSPPLPHG